MVYLKTSSSSPTALSVPAGVHARFRIKASRVQRPRGTLTQIASVFGEKLNRSDSKDGLLAKRIIGSMPSGTFSAVGYSYFDLFIGCPASQGDAPRRRPPESTRPRGRGLMIAKGDAFSPLAYLGGGPEAESVLNVIPDPKALTPFRCNLFRLRSVAPIQAHIDAKSPGNK